MYEHRTEPVASRPLFQRRVALHASVAGGIVALSLGIGALGYHVFAALPWVDAVLNAAMILTGMGPVDPLPTPAAKIFATVYALYSGIAFLAITGLLVAPFVHRLLHRLHAE
jgi:hypothetical protein